MLRSHACVQRAAIIWVVCAAASAPAQTVTPPAAAGRPTFVLELAFLERSAEGTRQESTALGVTADGSVYVPHDTVGTLLVADRLGPQQVSGLLEELDRTGRLSAIDGARLHREVQEACRLAGFHPQVEGAAATIIRCRGAQGPVEVRCEGLSVMAARFPDFPELQRLLAVQLRLQNVAAVARAGGEQASLQLAQVANRTLQTTHPALPPLTTRDLSMVRELSSGSRYVQFYRSPTRTSEELLVSLFETPGQLPQVSVLANPPAGGP